MTERSRGARLRFPVVRERAPAAAVTLDFQLRDRRSDPPDDREKVEATERLFRRSDGTLAYRKGAQVPVEELASLVGEAEKVRTLRDPSHPQQRNRRSQPARKVR